MFEPRVSGWPRIRSIVRVTDRVVSTPDGSPHQMAYEDREALPGVVLFEKEPAGEAYRAILDFAAAHCHAFALAWRDQLLFDPAALDLARRLEPWLCFERHTHEWPGTELLDSKAWVRWYTVTGGSLAEVAEANGLYDWLSPGLPEDLAFYHRDGRGWVGSISHEGEGWLDLETFGADLSRDLLRVLADHEVVSAL